MRHVVPNIMAPIIIIFSINVGGVIIAEASLSFLGFGLPVQVPSWGRDAQPGGDAKYMEQAPRLALWPGLCLTIVVLRAQHVRRRGGATCSTPACAAAPGASTAPAAPPTQ